MTSICLRMKVSRCSCVSSSRARSIISLAMESFCNSSLSILSSFSPRVRRRNAASSSIFNSAGADRWVAMVFMISAGSLSSSGFMAWIWSESVCDTSSLYAFDMSSARVLRLSGSPVLLSLTRLTSRFRVEPGMDDSRESPFTLNLPVARRNAERVPSGRSKICSTSTKTP